jgi:hypothetical protein
VVPRADAVRIGNDPQITQRTQIRNPKAVEE